MRFQGPPDRMHGKSRWLRSSCREHHLTLYPRVVFVVENFSQALVTVMQPICRRDASSKRTTKNPRNKTQETSRTLSLINLHIFDLTLLSKTTSTLLPLSQMSSINSSVGTNQHKEADLPWLNSCPGELLPLRTD